MAAASRSAQFAKLHKVLKKHYTPVAPDPQRPVLEHLVFACLLENAHYGPAESAFAAVVHNLYDWNEVRVTSVAELCELMTALPDARAAAQRMKRMLQSVFESAYSFNLEDCRKKNLGPTVKWLEKLNGATPFAVSYAVQAALGGHQIPISQGTMSVLQLLGVVSEKEAATGAVPGLERAIAKSKGVEFGSLLQQLGADFVANPYAPGFREILREIDPSVTDRLPKRRAPVKVVAEESASKAEAVKSAEDERSEKTKPLRKKPEAKVEAAAPPPAAKESKGDGKAPPAKTKPETPRPATASGPQKPSAAKKKPAAQRSKPKKEPAGHKPAATGLAKKKPR